MLYNLVIKNSNLNKIVFIQEVLYASNYRATACTKSVSKFQFITYRQIKLNIFDNLWVIILFIMVRYLSYFNNELFQLIYLITRNTIGSFENIVVVIPFYTLYILIELELLWFSYLFAYFR